MQSVQTCPPRRVRRDAYNAIQDPFYRAAAEVAVERGLWVIYDEATSRSKSEIIDADSLQAQNADLRIGKHIGDISRMSEGKTWHIIGTLGPYLKIRTNNNNGCANTRLISADAYNQPDRYPSRLPVYRYPQSAPIIDADTEQINKAAPREIQQSEIIVAREAAE